MKQQMPSSRELIVQALTKALGALKDGNIKVFRNADKAQKVPLGALIILRDNEAAKEVDVLLSPLTYTYELDVALEVIVQHQDPAMRNYLLDALLMEIGEAISTNRTLYGLAEWCEMKPAEFHDEPVDGAATVRAANMPVIIRYNAYDFTGST